ncbi:MAG: ribosome-associated translation inhibitor RaiA [Actinomycetales bacterium]|nr:ribosome-associated translation inhibitor RaiA [Actinomycetales bacterium]
MEIVVVGRHTQVPDRFRTHVESKLAKAEQLAPRAQRIDVEITHESNPRQSDQSEVVEITVRGKGPVIRAEAAADDRYAALDLATAKLFERLRRHRDRIKSRRTAGPTLVPADVRPLEDIAPPPSDDGERVVTEDGAIEHTLGDSPVVIREKVHEAHPMTLDDALYEMELVGHDFFLFVDAETAQPSVAYRRKGWSYGVIRLDSAVVGAGTGDRAAAHG